MHVCLEKMRTSWPRVAAILKTNKHVHMKDDKQAHDNEQTQILFPLPTSTSFLSFSNIYGLVSPSCWWGNQVTAFYQPHKNVPALRNNKDWYVQIHGALIPLSTPPPVPFDDTSVPQL